MEALKIQLLGNFRLTYGDRPWTAVSSPRLQEFLAYLLLNMAAPVPRARLAATFWPVSSDAQARTNLRNLLYQLQNALPDDCDCLLIDRQTVRWNTASDFQLDVNEFEAAAEARHLAELEQGVAYYSGDLLPELYEDWVLAERERLRRTLDAMLARMALLQEQHGAIADAIVTTRKLVQRDPLHEEHTVALMRRCALNGDRVGVRRAYEALVAALHDELGVEPVPATREAYDECLRASLEPHDQQARPARRRTLRSKDLRRLPAQVTSFVGREREVAEVTTLLDRSQIRLVTLTGVGGSGKTRLALQVADTVADYYEDGVVFVPLETILDEDLVLPQIMSALNLSAAHAVSSRDSLTAFLRDKQLLLILDNFEQVLGAGPAVSDILREAPGVKVLATSREGLRLYGEWQVPVLPLDLPPADTISLAPAEESESIRLLVERARAVVGDFELTTENTPSLVAICRKLEGLPLSLELAAARLKHVAPQVLVDQLDARLDTLTGDLRDVPPRHRALRSLIDWSYELLDLPEQTVYARLGVFAGGWSEEAAGAVCADETIEFVPAVLHSLLDKNLIRRTTNMLGEGRYGVLETIREHAAEKFALGNDVEAIADRHAEYYHELAWTSPELSLARHSNLQSEFRLLADLQNFHKAAERLLELGRMDEMWAISQVLVELWPSPEMYATLMRRAQRALDSDNISNSTWVWCRFWLAREQVRQNGELDLAFADDALAPVEQMAIEEGVNKVLAHTNELRGRIARRTGDYSLAAYHWRQSLEAAIASGDAFREAVALNLMGTAAFQLHDYAESRRLAERSVALSEVADNAYRIWPNALLIVLDYEDRSFDGMAQHLGSTRRLLERLPYSLVPHMWWTALLVHGIYAGAIGRYEDAVRILGQVNRLGNEDVWDRANPEKDFAERELTAARAALGDEGFVKAWTEGQEMFLEDVWALATRL